MNNYTYKLDIIKVNRGWAQRATRSDGMKRYRGYCYKKEAIAGLSEWDWYLPPKASIWAFDREFWHNFHSAEELGLSEQGK